MRRRGQIVGDADRDGGAAVIDRDQRDDAGADALLGLVDQAAQGLGIQPVEHLADEAVAADLLRPLLRSARAAAAHRQRLLRLGELALEPAAVVEQGGDAGRHFLGRGLERRGGLLEAVLALGQPQARRLAGQRLDAADAGGDGALARRS